MGNISASLERFSARVGLFWGPQGASEASIVLYKTPMAPGNKRLLFPEKRRMGHLPDPEDKKWGIHPAL
jgi:hypothetical protein